MDRELCTKRKILEIFEESKEIEMKDLKKIINN